MAMPAYVDNANAATVAQANANRAAPQAVPAGGVSCACNMTNDTPDFPSAKNRAARLAALARSGYAPQESAPARHGILTASDYAVALGKPHPGGGAQDDQVANAFAQAWAEDGDVLHYRDTNYSEPDAPPDQTSRAAAGWQPAGTTTLPQVQLHYTRAPGEQANQLFEAYGASYTEAYSVALAIAFSEDKPLPDDATGDVTGSVNSILHTPGGTPILLGTVFIDDKPPQEDSDLPDIDATLEPPLSFGRKALRFMLLLLGAGALAVSGLYFTGYLL